MLMLTIVYEYRKKKVANRKLRSVHTNAIDGWWGRLKTWWNARGRGDPGAASPFQPQGIPAEGKSRMKGSFFMFIIRTHLCPAFPAVLVNTTIQHDFQCLLLFSSSMTS